MRRVAVLEALNLDAEDGVASRGLQIEFVGSVDPVLESVGKVLQQFLVVLALE
jgi:hypothetical protein